MSFHWPTLSGAHSGGLFYSVLWRAVLYSYYTGRSRVLTTGAGAGTFGGATRPPQPQPPVLLTRRMSCLSVGLLSWLLWSLHSCRSHTAELSDSKKPVPLEQTRSEIAS